MELPRLQLHRAVVQESDVALFPIELEAASQCQEAVVCASSHVLQQLLELSKPSDVFETRVLRDVLWQKSVLVAEEGTLDIVVLAAKLANIGYRTAVRTALGGGKGQACFHNLHHEFLVVLPESAAPSRSHSSTGEAVRAASSRSLQHNSSNASELRRTCSSSSGSHHSCCDCGELIVEAHFREHFAISSPTPAYQQLVDVLPEVFVGTPSKLRQLVKLMCLEMAAAFKANSVTIPPWRHSDSMLSKWLPAKLKDTPVGAPPSPVSSSGSVSGSLDDLSLLIEAGISPTGPLLPYDWDSHGEQAADSKANHSKLSADSKASASSGDIKKGVNSTACASSNTSKHRHSNSCEVATSTAACNTAATSQKPVGKLRSTLRCTVSAPAGFGGNTAHSMLHKPRSSTTGFKIKSLLSSGLAAVSGKRATVHPVSEGNINHWEQPAIRTVKMAGKH